MWHRLSIKKIRGISFLLLFLLFMISCTVIGGRNPKVLEGNCITHVWYDVSQTLSPDKVFLTLNLPDSALLFTFLLEEERFKYEFEGSIFNIDTFHIISHNVGACLNEASMIIGLSTSPLTSYTPKQLDLFFIDSLSDFKITILDTLTKKEYEYTICKNGTEVLENPWFRYIPKWLFLGDSIP